MYSGFGRNIGIRRCDYGKESLYSLCRMMGDLKLNTFEVKNIWISKMDVLLFMVHLGFFLHFLK